MVVRWFVFVLFAISTIGWNVSANLTDNSELTTMYLMCESSSDCYLSDEFSGQETLTGTINQASPFNPTTLLFEFEMRNSSRPLFNQLKPLLNPSILESHSTPLHQPDKQLAERNGLDNRLPNNQ